MTSNNKKTPVFAVDTNVVITMYYLNKNWIARKQTSKFFEEVKLLMELARKKEILLVIPLSVVLEINRNFWIAEAFKQAKFAYSDLFLRPDIRKLQQKDFIKKLKYTANVYAKNLDFLDVEIINKNGKRKAYNKNLAQPIFDINADGTPNNDALIMAEAALFGIPIITFDRRDFFHHNATAKIAYKNDLMGLSKDAIPINATNALIMIKEQLGTDFQQEARTFQ